MSATRITPDARPEGVPAVTFNGPLDTRPACIRFDEHRAGFWWTGRGWECDDCHEDDYKHRCAIDGLRTSERSAPMNGFKRLKVEDGLYEIIDPSGARVAQVWEGGKSGYRWTVSPTAPINGQRPRGWDSTSLANAVVTLAKMYAPKETK